MSGLVKKLDWDTKHFGFPVARLVAAKLTASQMQSALKSCRRNKIKCLYFTVDSDDRTSIRLAEENGFRFAGIRLTFLLDLPLRPPLMRGGKKRGHSDLPELKEMSRGLYLHSRFYFDERFSQALADKLFERWVERLQTFVWRKQGRIAGYVGWSGRGKKARIELFGIRPEFQGRGAGKALLGGFLAAMRRRGFHEFATATQGSNIAAQRLYEGAGFRIKKSEIDYHKWF